MSQDVNVAFSFLKELLGKDDEKGTLFLFESGWFCRWIMLREGVEEVDLSGDADLFPCKYCGKAIRHRNGLTQHVKVCVKNPDRKKPPVLECVNPGCGYSK